jgi:hypothetical protein
MTDDLLFSIRRLQSYRIRINIIVCGIIRHKWRVWSHAPGCFCSDGISWSFLVWGFRLRGLGETKEEGI